MRTSLAARLMLAGTLFAVPAGAQVAPGQAPSPAPQGAARSERLERLLDVIEDNAVVRLLASPDGFGIRMGGIEGGSGFAFGPSWQSRRLLGGRLEFHASGAIAPFGDRAVDAGVTVPEFLSSAIRLHLFTGSTHLGRESFYGMGPQTSPDHRSTFTVDRRRTAVAATIAAAGGLEFSTLAGVMTTTAADIEVAGVPAISARWPGTPALHTPITFTVVSAGTAVDLRDVPGNPRRGGRYAVRVERMIDRSVGRHSFNRIDVDVEQHISWWRGQRLLTVRALAIGTEADRGHEVPFYLQPTLGGSAWLRGFANDRFRDRHVLAMQAEYGWDIWPFLNAVLFYEMGQVAPEWADLFTQGFERDYGFGFRFGSARTVAVRTDIAFGSGEGTRFSTRFSHAF